MANKSLFKSTRGRKIPDADTLNRAGGTAYALSAKQAVAQYSATGCFGNTYYTSAETQLTELQELLKQCPLEFVAQCAIYSRTKGFMKDMPAFLLAHLVGRGPQGVSLAEKVFPRVIDNGKMVRNFVQVVRSGVIGRKSMGTAVKRMVRNWFYAQSPEYLFKATVGNNPSLVDVIKMVRPKPKDPTYTALFGYLIARDPGGYVFQRKADDSMVTCQGWEQRHLPMIVKEYLTFKMRDPGDRPVPDVPFQMLDSLKLTEGEWLEVARRAHWQMARMNLNTFHRHGVFKDLEVVKLLASKISSAEEVRKSRCFPYQLLTAYKHVDSNIPAEIKEALQDAMEEAISNVPELPGKVVVCPDVSGSMTSPVTGHRSERSSKTACVDVAALMTAALLRVNRLAWAIPFADSLPRAKINPRDSVMTISRQIAALRGGGTNLSLPLAKLNQEGAEVDILIYVSDYESWLDSTGNTRYGGTKTMQEWEKLKRRCPKAKMVCIDIVPNATSQTVNRDDILNIGGFSDSVFDLLRMFCQTEASEDSWVKLIEEIAF